MKLLRQLRTAILMMLAMTLLCGVAYPFAVTVLAQLFFSDKANGQLIVENGRVVGSRIIGQRFTSPGYFYSRPSAAGDGYDAAHSGGTNLGPLNPALLDAVRMRVAAARLDNPRDPVPVDLVTASGSGLDPDISPAAALFQVARVARARRISESELRVFVTAHVEDRQFGLLGEPRVNVLLLNLALDERWPSLHGRGAPAAAP